MTSLNSGEMNWRVFTLLFLQSLAIGTGHSQYKLEGFDLSQGDHASWYDKQMKDANSALYEGTFFPLTVYSKNSHPLFEEMYWAVGEITYRGQTYLNVHAVYDISADIIVLRNPNLPADGREFLKINQAQVSEFKIHDKTFVRLDSTDQPPEGVGFYQLLFDGDKVQLICKRRKQKDVRALQTLYDERNRYYLVADDNYLPCRNRKSLIALLPGSKKQIKDYLKRNRIRIKPGRDNVMSEAVAFVDGLMN